MNIGDKIKSYRKAANLTQEELALKCGLSRNAIYNYEKGKRQPPINVLENIARNLKTTILNLTSVDTALENLELPYSKAFIKNDNNYGPKINIDLDVQRTITDEEGIEYLRKYLEYVSEKINILTYYTTTIEDSLEFLLPYFDLSATAALQKFDVINKGTPLK